MTWIDSLIIGYLLIHQIKGEYYQQCYNGNNYQHCLWTDLTQKTWQEAKDACTNANNSVLISVTSSKIQSALEQFRSNVTLSKPDIDSGAVWIDVRSETVDSFHWITGDRGAATIIHGQNLTLYRRFGAINFNTNNETAFHAQPWNMLLFYICQYSGAANCNDGYRRNSVCYVKYNESVTWFTASNRCLSMGRSLATFNDLAKPTDDISLMSWLNITATTKYWVGLVQRWLVTTIQGGSVVDVQYTNWESGNPSQQPSDTDKRCVALKSHGSTWIDTESCTNQQRFICQVISPLPSTTATTTASTTTTTRSTSTTRTALTKPPLSLTSSSANAVIGGPDGLSSTTILVANESSPQESSTSSVGYCQKDTSIAVGLAVGLGVPLLVSIVANVVLLQRNKKLSDATNRQKTQHDVMHKEPHSMNGAPEKVYTSLGVTSPDAAHHLYSHLQGATPSDANTPVTSSQVYASLDVSPPEGAGHLYAHLQGGTAGNC